ncbi:ABC transporter permease [Mycolicibacterium wolinskyi]|uniref:ABC transporter permease n=2 Tax=Mycobacteriaceae TaxID=1762 RepID=A0A1X2ES06_9MYCO|nr:ABC transporter permease [Mycolicibacterium wolinskyi]MCV7297698.1 ABC transporter permease [Mycolicibacterium goodii]ORX08937.1 ABC transporter permease [Mycolicibacterium wolinskyi]
MSTVLSRPGRIAGSGDAAGLVDPRAAIRKAQRRPVVPRALQRLLGPVLLVVGWQVLSTTGIFDERTVPPPTRVLRAAWTLIADGTFQEHLVASLLRVGYGLAFGIVLGLALALISGLSRVGENFVDANMEVLRAVPNFALVPLLIVWFGISEVPKILLITLAVAVAIYINTFSAIRSVDAALVEAARSFGAGRAELIYRVIVPGSLPGFLVGLRLALTASWLSLIFAETINAKKGLGRMMTDAREYFQIDVVFVLIAVYAILGLVSILVVRFLEARLLTWRRAYDGD